MYPSSLRISRESYALPRTSSSTLFQFSVGETDTGWVETAAETCAGCAAVAWKASTYRCMLPRTSHAVRTSASASALAIAPSIMRDSVAGDHGPGAVRAAAAVYEDGVVSIKQTEHLRDLLSRRRASPPNGTLT